jgi:hypothetical protein
MEIFHDFLDISRYIKKSCRESSKRKLEERQEEIFSKIFGSRATKKKIQGRMKKGSTANEI